MKIKQYKEELKKLSLSELHTRLDELRRDYFSLKVNAMTSVIKDYSQFKKVKAHIRRVSTLIGQRESSQENNA
ncbi:50S ribosomal protein L29 [Vermiphilus pyriformis]|jgi:ribosomal protein L29|uniref:Large ribosomal subunit protein uL29 n=1 Tax=candidate division TM6 bacterium JCVI TM6SC1 TaxID=1306947 RepID=A0A0D2JLS3_9BACT|nr:hypothetical protein J120_03235 [candidate division TM6 bacterium JCVI TM6SC1]UNE35371.1 MAG: 50S ribosomal protein L29 [Vermiphilus pyriformis]